MATMERQSNVAPVTRVRRFSDFLFGLAIIAISGYIIFRTVFKWRHITHSPWSDRLIYLSLIVVAFAALVGVGRWLFKRSRAENG